MTKRREWPNVAKEARDRAEEAVRGLLALRPLLENEQPFTQTDEVRRIAIAVDALHKIARLLEGVGAQTVP